MCLCQSLAIPQSLDSARSDGNSLFLSTEAESILHAIVRFKNTFPDEFQDYI